ncbi:MAG: hypothetical protein KR126chlam4_01211 [Candidatus Anoxychlamydiales bacterium]|nr:hypothetical protein [Candidatus Anoxychlamydiales bacterium]
MVVPSSQYKVLKDSGVFRLAFHDEFFGKPIRKYILIDQKDETITKAAKAIYSLLSQNSDLCATFKTRTIELIKTKLETNRYLTINGFAVCLAKSREIPSDASREFNDKYFSETLLKKPVRCSQGHVLEMKSAKFWVSKKGDTCPAGEHTIGELEVDRGLQKDIGKYKKTTENMDAFYRDQKLKDLKNRILEATVEAQGEQLSLLSGIKNVDTVLMVGAGAKIVIKVVGKKACKEAGKLLTKELAKEVSKILAKEASKKVAKFAGKSLGKVVPGVSVGIGVTLAVYRIKKGMKEDSNKEYIKAVGEIASGILACWPGPGTAASVSLDIILAGSDIADSYNELQLAVCIDLTIPYKYLGIDIEKGPEPSQTEIDKAYRKNIRIIHPDDAANIRLGEYYSSDGSGPMTDLSNKINSARDEIYKARGLIGHIKV